MPRIANVMDTADRYREASARAPEHGARDAEADARNVPRVDTTDYAYRRPMNLDAPTPRPGYVQRWVRAEFRDDADNLNWQAKLREGWRPRDPSTVPEAEAFFSTTPHKGQAVIRVGGLILMEAPEQLVVNKRRAIKQLVRSQEQSVLHETEKVSRDGVRSGAPPIVREEEGQVTTGRRPNTMAD